MRPSSTPWIRAAVALLGLAGLPGCGATAPPAIARIVDGQAHEGPYVAPHVYEAFVRAELAMTAGHHAEAEELYRVALRGAPDDPLLHARLAEALALRGEDRAADDALEDALALDPGSEAAWLARGRIAERRGEVEAALDGYARALALAPSSLEPALALAQLLAAQGETGRAEALLLEQAERRGAAGARAAREGLDLALARGDGPRAERAARALLRLAPARRAEVLGAARAALERGQAALAAHVLDAVPAAPDDASLRARAYLAAGRAEDARATIVRAADGAPAVAAARARQHLEAGAGWPDEEGAPARAEASGVEAAWLAGREALARGRDEEGALYLASIPEGTRYHEPARADLARALADAGLTTLACELLSAHDGATSASSDARTREARRLGCDGRDRAAAQ